MSEVLVDDHAEVDALLRGLLDAFGRGDAGEVLTKLDYVWARLAMHIRAEHLHLFPALLESAEGVSAAPGAPAARVVREAVERLREDHDFFMRELAGAVNEARELASQEEAAAREPLRRIKGRVQAVAERLAEHNLVEERQVYLWPGLLLGETARDRIRREMKREIENLPPRFSEGPPR